MTTRSYAERTTRSYGEWSGIDGEWQGHAEGPRVKGAFFSQQPDRKSTTTNNILESFIITETDHLSQRDR